MNHSFFTGEHVRLRAMEPEDLEVLYAIENDPPTWDVSNHTVPYSRYRLKQYIESSECDLFADLQLRLMIVVRADEAVAGTIDITDFSPLHARGEVGIAVRSAYRGRGYGKEALDLLAEYAFRFLHMKQLTSHVAADNAASLHLFEQCGFVRCGLLREWWRTAGEGYQDVVLLQLLR